MKFLKLVLYLEIDFSHSMESSVYSHVFQLSWECVCVLQMVWCNFASVYKYVIIYIFLVCLYLCSMSVYVWCMCLYQCLCVRECLYWSDWVYVCPFLHAVDGLGLASDIKVGSAPSHPRLWVQAYLQTYTYQAYTDVLYYGHISDVLFCLDIVLIVVVGRCRTQTET